MSKALLCIFGGLISLIPPLLKSQTPAKTAAQPLPVQSTTIKDVPVPVPSEVFTTLDRFAHSNWRAVQRPELGGWKPHEKQAGVISLMRGLRRFHQIFHGWQLAKQLVS